MKRATTFLLLLAIAAVLEVDAGRTSSSSFSSSSSSPSPPNHRGSHPGWGVPGFGSNTGGFFGPGGGGGGFGIPGFGGWNHFGDGYGFGAGGPAGGSGWHGVVRPSVVCSEKGPCYKQKLTCPAKCFTSYTNSGKGYGGGGGGGGCTFDCKKCVAHC